MPSDVMDQRHISYSYRPSAPSSFFSENGRFPSEKQFGFASIASLPDHNGLEAMSLGGNAVSSSTLENICPIGGKFVESLEIPHGLFKNLKINNNTEHHLIGAGSTVSCWRAPDQDGVSPSMLCSQPASLSVEAKKVDINGGHYKNGFFPSSLSDILNKTLRLSSNDIFVDRSVNTIQPNIAEVEAFESVEEAEAHTIRDLLPDDDDLLSGALHDLGYVAHSNRVDVEDDLFCSVGGMELESDNFVFEETSEYDIEGAFNGQERGLDNIPSSEFAQGEEPTRTLYVENIISSIEDLELRILFEQFGDIQTFLTSSGQRGCTIVSYYDIRAAQNAKRVLQSKSIRGQKLDMRFCVSKDNSSGREINEGVLLVTNLESSILNVDLLHIFGVYGEIKQICQIPHGRHHKCIEFYDVRAADAALSAINKCDIAGRRIKVEPWDQREPRISSKQQVSVDLEEEESSRCRADSYSKKLPCFAPSGLIKLGANTSSDLPNDATQGMHTAFEMQIGSCTESKFHGISSSIHHNLSSTGIVAMVENHFSQSSNYENTNSIRRMNLGFENMATFPEFHGGVASGVSFNSPSTMSGMAMNASSTLANGIDNRNIHRVSSGSHGSHFKHNEAVFNVSGNGSFPLHGHEFIWNGPNTYNHHYPGSLMWQNLPPLVNNIPVQSPQMGLARGSMLNPVLPPNLHVGSAPVVDPLFWNARHATFTGDATSFDPSSLASLGYSSCSQLQSVEHNIFPQASGTCIDPSIATMCIGVPSPQQKGHMFRGRNNLVFNSRDAPSDRIRSRKSDTSSSNADSRKQYELDIDRIIQGEDARTTLMIKNIPNKYTSKMLLATIDEQHKGTYDFIYLPIDFKNKCNVGYAFINMTDPGHIIPFYKAFNGKKWEKFNSEKVAYLAYARIQGKYALIAHFQNSSLMNEDKRCRPILFHSEGPNAGDQEPFPVGVNIQSRRSRTRNENHQKSPSGSSSSGDEYSSSAGSTKNS